MNNIDIRIFGVPERIKNIDTLKKILNIPDEKIIIDKEHSGVIPTAKKVWLLETNKEYTMVLQDDIELCENFIGICTRIIAAMPKKIISLFPLQFQRRVELNRSGGIPKNSPYIKTNVLSGCGIIMPTEYVKPCIDSWDPDARCDDTSIYVWAEKNNIDVITTLPATIQHIGDKSFFSSGRIIRTELFEKNPIASWDSNYITPWTNLKR